MEEIQSSEQKIKHHDKYPVLSVQVTPAEKQTFKELSASLGLSPNKLGQSIVRSYLSNLSTMQKAA